MPNALENGANFITQALTQGYVGVRTDPTPLANYTVLGHQTNTATPESKGQRRRTAPVQHTNATNWGE